MKANELTSKDLMVGDWVIVKGVPTKIYDIDKIDGINREWIAGCEDGGCTCFKDIQPIPLTPEILEKNGFNVVRGNRIMGLQVSDRCTLRIGDGMKEMRVEMQDWGETEERKWFIEIRNLGSINLQLYIGYTHELQHALRLCKVDKEIVL